MSFEWRFAPVSFSLGISLNTTNQDAEKSDPHNSRLAIWHAEQWICGRTYRLISMSELIYRSHILLSVCTSVLPLSIFQSMQFLKTNISQGSVKHVLKVWWNFQWNVSPMKTVSATRWKTNRLFKKVDGYSSDDRNSVDKWLHHHTNYTCQLKHNTSELSLTVTETVISQTQFTVIMLLTIITVLFGVTLSRCVCVRRAAYITYRLHAALVSAVKVMCCIQCSLVM